jgi:hypothetical protein
VTACKGLGNFEGRTAKLGVDVGTTFERELAAALRALIEPPAAVELKVEVNPSRSSAPDSQLWPGSQSQVSDHSQCWTATISPTPGSYAS